jgi:hypothetical protein
MMGRIVRDMYMPLQDYAPLEPNQSSLEPPHNTCDIVPDILPPPSLSTNRKDFLENISEASVRTSLTELFGLELAKTGEEKMELESQLVKRYTMENPKIWFTKLMENELYAKDACNLLHETSWGKAYFVTGFLTTTSSTWTSFEAGSHGGGVNAELPIAAMTGVPMGELGSPEVKSSYRSGYKKERQMQVAEEEIFAVAYSVVKNKFTVRGKPTRIRMQPRLGQPKLAKASGQNFGDEESDSDDEVDGSNETFDSEDGIVFVEGDPVTGNGGWGFELGE